MVENDNIVIVEETDLKDYWQVIIRRKWVIIVSLVALVTIGAMHTYNITPVYKATVQVVIDRENPNVVSIDEVVRMDREELPWNQTELRILSSRSLAHRVVKALNLKDSPEFKTNGKKRNFRKDFLYKGSLRPRGPAWVRLRLENAEKIFSRRRAVGPRCAYYRFG